MKRARGSAICCPDAPVVRIFVTWSVTSGPNRRCSSAAASSNNATSTFDPTNAETSTLPFESTLASFRSRSRSCAAPVKTGGAEMARSRLNSKNSNFKPGAAAAARSSLMSAMSSAWKASVRVMPAVKTSADSKSALTSAREFAPRPVAASWNAQHVTKRVRRSPGDTVARRSNNSAAAASTRGTRYAAAARGRSFVADSSASISKTVLSAMAGRPVFFDRYLAAAAAAAAASSQSSTCTSSKFAACSTPNSRRKYRA
mmetsp:Transcript_28227/g.87322  ORF Transcript_28227/g.87322 Transcript_28227/m.87322 type:complete len:258 (-) Transcript_28227:406-1179(-)